MITKLQSYKQSVITEAVTKGLDKNVLLKDSGIKWIGEIPKHWEASKTLFVLSMSITDGPHTTPELLRQEFLLFQLKQFLLVMAELIFHILGDIYQKSFIRNVVRNIYLKLMIYI